MTSSLRPCELAGHFYPASAEACREILAGWPAFEPPDGRTVGALVPHGGWRYAGRIAAGTLGALKATARPDLLIVLGAHMEPGMPIRVFIEGDWETPLGPVETATPLAESVAMALSAEPETAEEYYDDNAIEVLMPMIRHFWPGIPSLVLGAPPDVDPGSVARELAAQTMDRGFLCPSVIGSCDLTHYGPDHRFRPRGRGLEAHRWVMEDNDAALIRHFEALNAHRVIWDGPRRRNTCSAGAAGVALALAKAWGASEARCLAQSSSWLEAGRPDDVDSFVGYAGLVLGAFS